MERTDHGYLENELEIKMSPRFPPVNKTDVLEVFESRSNFGCVTIFVLVLSIILYFLDKVTLMVFLFTLLISAVGYLWRYKYTFKKKPVIVISSTGIKEKNYLYPWGEMSDLSCSEEYDSERGLFTATHLRFIYQEKVKKIYIGGHSKSTEEIIHYVKAFILKKNRGFLGEVFENHLNPIPVKLDEFPPEKD